MGFTLKSMVMVLACAGAAAAAPLTVLNSSFESPAVIRDDQNPFGALPFIDDWDETAPGDTDEFDQNTGVFLNTDPSSPDHITNAHLERMAFASSLVGNGIRQILADSYGFGQVYTLTVAVGKSAMFPVGDTEELEIGFFYMNGGVEQVILSIDVPGHSVGTTVLSDFTIIIPPISPGDAWANQPIGVFFRPTLDDLDDSDGEGFWNLDNVRVVPEPATLALFACGAPRDSKSGR